MRTPFGAGLCEVAQNGCAGVTMDDEPALLEYLPGEPRTRSSRRPPVTGPPELPRINDRARHPTVLDRDESPASIGPGRP